MVVSYRLSAIGKDASVTERPLSYSHCEAY